MRPGGILASLATASSNPTKALNYYDELRWKSSFYETDESSYAVKVTSSREDGSGSEGKTYRMCNIASFLALSNGEKHRSHSEDEAAAIQLAVYHFNNGIDYVVPQLRGLPSRCNVRLTADIFDTKYSPIESVRTLMSDRILGRAHSASTPHPCGVLGAWRSAVSQPLSTVALTVGETRRGPIPVVSYGSESSELDNKDQYPLFGRTVASVAGMARVIVSYLSKLHVLRAGMLYVTDAWGSAYEKAFTTAASEKGIKVAAEPVFYDGLTSWEARSAVQRFKDGGYKYIVCAIFVPHFNPIMREAVLEGMAGEDSKTLWIFVTLDKNNFLAQSNFASSDPLSKITSLAFFQQVGGVPYLSGRKESHDRFIEEWSDMNAAEVREYVRNKIPADAPGIAANLTFQFKGEWSYFAYDVVMAYGLAACNTATIGSDGQSVASGGNEEFFTSEDLYSSYLKNEFDGASGPVQIDETTGSRDYHSAIYTIDNVLQLPNNSTSDGVISFRFQPSMVYARGKWMLRPDGQDFIYSDNTTTPPPSLPAWQHETALLSVGAHAFGVVLCCVSLTLSMIFGAWTMAHRRTVIVKCSQPLFLGILCVGTFVMALAIIPMSLVHPTSASCIAVPWLFSFGFILAFSALLTKTLRVNQIFFSHTRRRVSRVVVKPIDVLKPFVFLFMANLAVLLSWTIVSPLESYFVASKSVDRFARPTELYPACFPRDPSWRDWTFLLTLIAINACALLYANFEAYRGRNIRTSFSEAKFIMVSMVALLQAFLIGIPVMIIPHGPTARFVVLSCFIMITCVAILLPIFVPKIMFLNDLRAQREREEMRRRLQLKKQWQMQSLKYGEWASEASVEQINEADAFSNLELGGGDFGLGVLTRRSRASSSGSDIPLTRLGL